MRRPSRQYGGVSVTSRALWYVESHLSSDLSLETIADVVGVSRFHLSRAFGTTVGCSLASYIRGRRLSEAARALASGAPDILTVALDYGYGSHEAFTRAFRQQFGVTPEQLRQRGSMEGVELMSPTRIDDQTTTPIAPARVAREDALLIFGLGQRYHTNAGIPLQWDRFVPYLGTIRNQLGKETYGVICNPDDTGSYEYITGVRVSEFPEEPAEFSRLRIPPQTYAVFEHKDHVSSVGATWGVIWDHAIADAGYRASDGPAFERYSEPFDGRTGLGGFELWVPIAVDKESE
jgi:AraC family transcriptional regulator